MTTILTSTVCVDCRWFVGQNGCPDTFTIELSQAACPQLAYLSVDFAGRGKVGGLCGGSDQYVTFANNPGCSLGFGPPPYGPTATIDVWGAYRDGVWSSSVSILCYADSNQPAVLSRWFTYPTNNRAATTDVASFIPANTGACPTILLKTATVMDDGTYT